MKPYLSLSEGWLYAATKGGRLKIGWSADPCRRAEAQRWTLLKVQPGSRAEERQLQIRLRRYAFSREWFRDCPTVRAAFAEWLSPERIRKHGDWMPGGRLLVGIREGELLLEIPAPASDSDLAKEDRWLPGEDYYSADRGILV